MAKGAARLKEVLRKAVKDMTGVQKDFICGEFGLSKSELSNAGEDELDKIYDDLCRIELEETLDDSELTERGKLVESIVTLMGNAIAEDEGFFDEVDG